MMRFSKALSDCKQTGYTPIIADFKMVSPKDGPLFTNRDPVEWAKKLEAAGAPALSVVTEPKDFGGSMRLLEQVSAAVSVPVLRKDFVQTTDDLRATMQMGGSAILLICACLKEKQLRKLYSASLEMGLEPLVETHTAKELALAKDMGCTLIGINNRNILQLERDDGAVSTTALLASQKPQNALLISESGIYTREDVTAAIQAGADAVLVGTAIWKADDPADLYRKLCGVVK